MTFTHDELQAMNRPSSKNRTKGFTPKAKGDPRGNCEAACSAPTAPSPLNPQPPSTAILTARQSALALSTQSHDAMSALQEAGLQNAAAYVHRKTLERNSVVDKVSDAIAYLSDPDLLESDIMSAAAAKIQARSGAWGYAEPVVDFDNLFALPTSSQRMLGGV